MKYQLSSMVERKPGTTTLVPIIEPPPGLERSMLARLRKLLHEMARLFRELILPSYTRTQELIQDTDETTWEQVRLAMRAMAREVSRQVQDLMKLEGQRHTKAWMAIARKTFGIDLAGVIQEEDLTEYLQAAGIRNAGLITSLSDDLVKWVQQETMTSVINGEGVRKLQNRIRKQLNIGDSRARLIARDQTSKLTADLNRIRHQQAGVNEYIWRTAKDERVRTRHVALEGRKYKYGEPTGAEEGLPPGQPIQCRCVAQAVVEF